MTRESNQMLMLEVHVPPTLTLLIPPLEQSTIREITSTASTGFQKKIKITKPYKHKTT